MSLNKPYSFGPYDKSNKDEQWIRLTEGCPHSCPYCYEPKEYKVFPMPEIVRNSVKLMDMNLLAKPEAVGIIRELGGKKVGGKVVNYELICGLDYRFLTDEIAGALKKSRFKNLRVAWDWLYTDQKKVKNGIERLLKAGYGAKDITIFMICNWKIPYAENLKKLNLCKYWNVKVADCWFDGQSPPIKPVYWTAEQIKDFRHQVRKHNQICNFKIDPELKGENQNSLLI
jgi:hypothetical protein